VEIPYQRCLTLKGLFIIFQRVQAMESLTLELAAEGKNHQRAIGGFVRDTPSPSVRPQQTISD